MTNVMTKIRLFIDYEKEEQWVNEMSQKGWHLKKFGFCYYTFEKGTPGEYIYRNEMVKGLGEKDNSKDYISFLNEIGVEFVSKSSFWAYFRKQASEGPFELYSDTSSKLQYLNKIYFSFSFLFLLNLLIGLLHVIDQIGDKLNLIGYLGVVNLLCAVLIGIPLYKVIIKRKNLKKQLDVFHD